MILVECGLSRLTGGLADQPASNPFWHWFDTVKKMLNGNLVGAKWINGNGDSFQSIDPSHGTVVWEGQASSAEEVGHAMLSARQACSEWWNAGFDFRKSVCERFAAIVSDRKEELARLISLEMGKALWDSRTEAGAVAAKVAISLEAIEQRRSESRFAMAGTSAVTRFRPHGVLAVLGPFNFPAHLPNGHIVPALLAGNTIVFKPSEMTPAVGVWMGLAWLEAGLPPGVLQIVQGGREVGEAIAKSPELDGLLFTGSSAAGRALHQLFGAWPQKILALEMGGNNPLVVHNAEDVDAAAYTILLSAFLSAGQRCTCSRRLIIVENDRTEKLLKRLCEMSEAASIGYWDDDPEPFCGTVISASAGQRIMTVFEQICARGGKPLLPMKSLRNNKALLSPGIVDVTGLSGLGDDEVFGPVLNVTRVPDFDRAIDLANDTCFGLSAGLISDKRSDFETFVNRIRAGIVNWNRQTTGASGKLPFGGCGLSGNHRPAGFYSADYCSWPVASLEADALAIPEKIEPGLRL